MTQPAPFSIQKTRTAFKLLSDAHSAREAELTKFNSVADLTDNNEETDSCSPVYNLFFRDGASTAIREMTKFTVPEFGALWNAVEANIRAKWDSER